MDPNGIGIGIVGVESPGSGGGFVSGIGCVIAKVEISRSLPLISSAAWGEPGFASGIAGVESGSAADSNGIGILGGEPGVEPDLMAVKVLVEGNIDG